MTRLRVPKSGILPSQRPAKLKQLMATTSKLLAMMAELGVEGGVLMSSGGPIHVTASSARAHARLHAGAAIMDKTVKAVLIKKFKDKAKERMTEQMMDQVFEDIYGKTRSSSTPGVDSCPFFEDADAKEAWCLSNRVKCTYKRKKLLLKATLQAIEDGRVVGFNAS